MLTAKPKGFVLIVVLGAVVALCALLVGFTLKAQTTLAQADGFYRSQQAWTAAWSGVQMAVALIQDANASGREPQDAGCLTAENRFTLGDANGTLVLEEENGLINVNRLTGTDGKPDRRHVEQLLRLIDALNHDRGDAPVISYGIVPALVDWIDTDDEVTALDYVPQGGLGAENDYYQSRRPPYPCRNGPVQVVEELAAVRGMKEVLTRLRPYLTCVGDGKIDLNAAPRVVLQSLSEQMDAGLAEMMIQHRKLQPFTSMDEVRSLPGMTDNLCRDMEALGTVKPDQRYYRVRARGAIQDHRCTIEALLRRNSQAAAVDITYYREL
jgi:general secretion pathway protein K